MNPHSDPGASGDGALGPRVKVFVFFSGFGAGDTHPEIPDQRAGRLSALSSSR